MEELEKWWQNQYSFSSPDDLLGVGAMEIIKSVWQASSQQSEQKVKELEAYIKTMAESSRQQRDRIAELEAANCRMHKMIMDIRVYTNAFDTPMAPSDKDIVRCILDKFKNIRQQTLEEAAEAAESYHHSKTCQIVNKCRPCTIAIAIRALADKEKP